MRASEMPTVRHSGKFSALCDELLSRGYDVRFRASGASMQPNVVEGDVLTVAPAEKSRIEAGDVVLTQTTDGLKAHRVIHADHRARTVITRGDSGRENDAPAQPLGKIISVQRNGRSKSTLGASSRVAAKFNSFCHRIQLSFWHRTICLLRYFFPVSLILLFGLFAGIAPAAAQTADIGITETPGSGTVLLGNNITYTIVVTNNSTTRASNTPSWVQATPTNTKFVSVAKPAGWNCTNPAVGGTGNVTCTDTANLAASGTASFTLVVSVNITTPGNSTISGSVTVSSSNNTNTANDTATSSVTASVADLSITETPASSSVGPGGTISYTIVVTNNGPSPANLPSWTQNTPTNTTFASITKPAAWNCTSPAVGGTGAVTCTDTTSLANAGTASFTLFVTVGAATPVNTVISGSVTDSSTSNVSAANDTATSSVTVLSSDLAITETPGSSTTGPSATISYTVVVTNNGPSSATPSWTQNTPTNTRFASITKPASWNCTTPSVGASGTITCTDTVALANAGTASFTLNVTVLSSVTNGTVISGSATVSSGVSDPTPGNNTATSSVTVVIADLALTQTPGSPTTSPGSAIAYTNVITNNGPATANTPVFTQSTPTNTTFQSVSAPAGWNCTTPGVGATGTITCTDSANLANAGTATITVNVVVNAGVADGSTISASANVSSTTGDSSSANNTATSNVTVSAPADLSITQTASAPVVAAGTNVVYTVVVTNNGPNQSSNVVFYENIPANTTFQSIGTVPTGWTCTTPAVNGTTPAIKCTIGTLANAGTATFTVTLQVNAGTAAETAIQNVTSVTSNSTTDPTATNNTSTTTTLVGITGNADLLLTLTASPNPVFVSSPLAYTVTVQNLGVANATGATITNTIPATTTFVSATASQGSCSQAAGVVTCNLGTLNAGVTATATINVTAPGTAISISDTASTTSGVTDPFLSNNSATLVSFVQPLSCATPANDGPGGTLTGTVNTYFAPSAAVVLTPGTKTVSLGAGVGSTTPIAVGDLLMIVQMQDATINATNTGAYGDGTAGDPATGYSNPNSSGRYEYITATSAVAIGGGTLNFTGAGPSSGLLNTYTQAAYTAAVSGQKTFQVIRVPQYQSATLSSTLTAPAWNGSIGGVLVLDVSGQLTLGGTVSLDAKGFRGGAGRQLGGGTGGAATDYITLATFNSNGSKGEGIAGTPRYIVNSALTGLTDTTVEGLPNGSYSRGAPGNAGGGGTDANPSGNDENSGGGGGGNGSGGGNGGYAWNTASLGNGFGGGTFPGSISAIIMGGGGGAGTTNNGTADPANANPAGINSSGAAGGGIIIIHAGTIVGTGTLTANGQSSLNVQNDGGGGGGAGGSIELLTLSGGISGATLSANGGDGGDTWSTQAPGGYPGARHGPGGGGGGGVILTSSAPAAANVLPGANGTSTTIHDSYGATPGLGNGIAITNLGTDGFTQTPGNRPGAQCSVADLVVTNSGSPNPVVPGGNITYTQTVNNNGPQPALNVTFSESIPANTTFVSFSSPAGWTCSTPSVGGTGNISCTLPSNDPNVLSTFTLVVQVGAGTVSGTTISDTDSVSSGVNDTNLANNTATVNTLVATPSSADISVTNSASPSTVAPSANITYTQSLTNNGPSTATTVSFTEAIPANTTFVSITKPGSWSCSTPAVGGTGNITCTIASLASGTTANFTVVANVNAGTATGTVITDTDMGSSAVTDPNSSNNSANASVTVAAANQADMAVTMTDSPNPVLAGANITYTAVVTNNGPATATTVTAVDTIPANTTFSSDVVPSGWTCVVNATTVSCSNPSMAANTSSTFTFVFTVTAGTAPGTVIVNSITTGSAVSDPNSANNTATTNTNVTSPSQADLSISKSASPEPVNQNGTLVYTITVANNGPASATSVVMTDPLPSAVSYQSSSSTQGTCSQSAGTVTCNIGTMSNGQIVTITINVTATTMSTSSYAVNTASVTSATSDPDNTNNSSTFSSTVAAPNVVQLVYFRAQPRAEEPGGVLLEWRTREEIRNLGFNIYREDALGRHRVNPSIVAGAALFVRGGKPQHGAKTYQWIDPSGTAESSYVLEDVDLNGTRTSHGPVAVESSRTPTAQFAAHKASRTTNALLLSQLNQVAAESASATTAQSRGRTLHMPRPTLAKVVPGELRASLDAMSAVKISVREEGWYRVTRSALIAAGLDANADARGLQLYAEGVEFPLLISGRGAGPLAANDYIEFYGTGIDTPFSDTRVYWLVQGTRPGKRITAIPSAASSVSDNTQGFPFTVLREDRTTYFATLLNGEDNDNFFGATVTSEPVEQTLVVANHAAVSSLPVTLDVTLQGATDGQAHRVSVSFNGASVGEMNFFGQANFTNVFPIDSSLITDGTNTVTLTALEGDNDVSVVQSIALHYPHTYIADQNFLRLTATAGSGLHITGFTSPQVRVFDITDPRAITQVVGSVRLEGTTYSVTASLRPNSPAERTLLAFADSEIASPALAYHAPSRLGFTREKADIIYVAHPGFVDSLAPLKTLRESQRHDVAIVTTDQLYDAYNFGERSPYAIRDFLQLAGSQNHKPQSVLFVGDASLDPRNYLGFGDFDFVPTRIVETAAFKTASDDWFTDFQSAGFATIATGRLPVRTPAEAALAVKKIVDYEQGSYAGTWNGQALVIADQNIGSNFSTSANNAAATLQPSLAVNKILADGQDPDAIRQQILTNLNNGSLLVDYSGHGSTEQWSFSNLLDNNSATALTNGQRLPVYLLMDCLNGFFHDVYTESLAESLLLSPNGGAVAVWASSGFTDAQPQAFLNQSLLARIAQNPNQSLGAAILAAKSGVTDSDVRRTWILFGDPAMRLQFPSTPPSRHTRPGRLTFTSTEDVTPARIRTNTIAPR